jgi:hypothetical protein
MITGKDFVAILVELSIMKIQKWLLALFPFLKIKYSYAREQSNPDWACGLCRQVFTKMVKL